MKKEKPEGVGHWITINGNHIYIPNGKKPSEILRSKKNHTLVKNVDNYKGLTYNNKDGLYINNKEEYGSLQSAVNMLQNYKKIPKRGICTIENKTYWYQLKMKPLGEFIVQRRIPMTEKNIKIIVKYERMLKNVKYSR